MQPGIVSVCHIELFA